MTKLPHVVFRPLLLAVVASVPTVGAVQAETPVTYTDNGQALFAFDVPDFWHLRTGGIRDLTHSLTRDPRTVSRLMGLQPVASEGIWMGLISPLGVRTTEDGLAYLQDIGPFLVKDAQVLDRDRRRIGGRSATVLSGQGRREGVDVAFTASVIPLPQGRVAIAVVVMEAGLDPALVNDVNAVFASFRAVR